jgi:uncharacterized protein DUF6263
MRTITTLLCTLLLISAGHAQKAKLSLNLEEGKTYRQITHSVSTLNQDVFGQKMEIVITIDGSISFLVNTVTKTGFQMTAQYDWMKISMEMPQGSMELSSENADEENMFSQLLAEMKLITFQLKMDRMGRILEMENVDAKWEAVIDQIPLSQAKLVKSQMMDAFGEDARTSSIEMLTSIFPEKAVKKGAQWSSITTRDFGMSLTLSNTYTYEGKENDLAIISVHSNTETSEKEAYDLSGPMISHLKVDMKSGWTREATIEQNLEGKAFIKDSEQIPGGMAIPMTIKNKTKITNE